jgi:hypothetical protein
MAESFAQIEARRKREAAAKAARPNTGKSQSVGGVLKSLLPGGQKANLGGLGQSAKNFAGEASGVYDIGRGVKELQKGNVAGGLGRIALGAVGFVPGVGAVSKGVSAAAKAAKASKVVTAAAKSKPVTALATSRPIVAATPVARAVARPVIATNKGLQNVATKAFTPVYKAKTPVGRFINAAINPATIAGVALSTVGALAAPTATGPTYRAPGVVPRGGGGTYLDINTATPGGAGGTIPPYTPTEPDVRPKPTPPVGDGGSGTGEGGTGTGDGGMGSGTGSGDTGMGSAFATSQEQTGALATGGGAASTGGATPVGIPGGVQVAGADFAANLAANAAQSYARQAGLREALAQGIEGVQGSAADIIGGRSQAILGQGLTGQRREYQTGMAGEVQRQVGEQEASRRAYNEAMSQAYSQQAQQILEAAQARSEQAAQIRRIG